MGALPQARPESALRKPPVSEKLDKYGRDPNSLPEQLRKRGEAWAPRPIAASADIHRLASGAVYYAFLDIVNVLSLGRPHAPKEPWYEWTEPYSAQEFAEYIGANVRDVQRKISELESRGMIAVKTVKVGGVPKYAVSLLYSKWRALEDYAIWKRRQVAAIDESLADETPDDEAPAAISKDAVVVSKPKRIAPGRASKAAKVNSGVSEFVIQNDSTCAVDCSSVLQSGRLVAIIKASAQATGELKAKTQCSPEVTSVKGEDKGKAERHACRALPANEGIQNTHTNAGSTISHPRAAELIKLFDPILQNFGRRLLSGDSKALQRACEAVGDCDHDYLVKHAIDRAQRDVKSPLHVEDICTDALKSWRTSKVLDGAGLPQIAGSPQKKGFADRLKAEAARRLEKYGRI